MDFLREPDADVSEADAMKAYIETLSESQKYNMFMKYQMVHTSLLYAGNSMVYSIHDGDPSAYGIRTLLVKYVPIDEEKNRYIDSIGEQWGRKFTRYTMSGIKQAEFNNEIMIQRQVYKETLPNSITSRILYDSILDINDGIINSNPHKFLRYHKIHRVNDENQRQPCQIGIVAMEYINMKSVGKIFEKCMIRMSDIEQTPGNLIIILNDKHGEVVKAILAKYFYSLILLTRIGVIHGDPHFDNVLVELSMDNQIVNTQMRIIDFGRSKFMNTDEQHAFLTLYANFMTGPTLINLQILANYIYELNKQIFENYGEDLRYNWIITPAILESIFPLVVIQCGAAFTPIDSIRPNTTTNESKILKKKVTAKLPIDAKSSTAKRSSAKSSRAKPPSANLPIAELSSAKSSSAKSSRAKPPTTKSSTANKTSTAKAKRTPKIGGKLKKTKRK